MPNRESKLMKYAANGLSAGTPRRLQVRPIKATVVRLKFAVFALELNPGYRIIWRTLHITDGTTIACTTSPKAPDERQTHRDGQSRIIGMIGASAKPVAVKLTNSMMLRRPAFILGSLLAKPSAQYTGDTGEASEGDGEFRDRKENFSSRSGPTRRNCCLIR